MRSWPGFDPSVGVVDHVTRRTRRDYETFGRMEPGDRYPQAIAIATARVHEKFQSLIDAAASNAEIEMLYRLRTDFDDVRGRGIPFKEWSPDLVAFTREIYPPYPEDKFVDKWRKLMPGEPSWTVTAHLGRTRTRIFTMTDRRSGRSLCARLPACSHSRTPLPSRETWGTATGK